MELSLGVPGIYWLRFRGRLRQQHYQTASLFGYCTVSESLSGLRSVAPGGEPPKSLTNLSSLTSKANLFQQVIALKNYI